MSVRVLSIDVGRKNLALCVLRPGQDARGADDVIEAWAVTACEPTPAGVRDALDAFLSDTSVDEVVIERQPPRNATMSRLQHYMEMYCAVRRLPAVVLDAKHKLAFAASTPWWPAAPLESWTYHTRKKVAVQTATAFLRATTQAPALVADFERSRKKDDFADSLLQAMAYAHHVRALDVARRGVHQATVKPRKPTAKALASGRLCKSAIAHMLLKGIAHAALEKNIEREFGTMDAARAACGMPSGRGDDCGDGPAQLSASPA